MRLQPHVLVTPQKGPAVYCNAYSAGRSYMAAQHQFSIGDDVCYLSSSKYASRASGAYRIVRLRPSETTDCQYWIRSALENFDRIAFQSELSSAQPQSRAWLGSSLPSSRPSRLKGMEQEWPPGVYEITTTEEALGDFMYEAFRRISTTIYLPPRSGDYGIGKVVDTDPAEMENITNHPSVS